MTFPEKPELAPIGERLRDRTAPLAPDDEANGYAHAYLSGALGAPLREVAEVFDPEGDVPPLAPLLDPSLCPGWALPWLGQLVGVAIPVGMSEADARETVRSVAGFSRGTRQAMEAAVGLWLTGEKTVYFRERDGDPYVLEVVTRTSETPDAAAVQRALIALKPGGIVLNYRTVAGWDYQAMTAAGGTYTALKTTYLSYRKLSDKTAG